MTATAAAMVPAPTVTTANAPSGHTFALPQKSSVDNPDADQRPGKLDGARRFGPPSEAHHHTDEHREDRHHRDHGRK